MQRKKLAQAKYLAYVATSIDGRIAKDGLSGTNWTSKEDWNFFQKELKKIDVIVVGHNTYKVVKARLKKRNTIVLTSRVNEYKVEGTVVFFNPEKENLKQFLENKKYKKIGILGGGQVYDFCLRNKMLHELFVTIEPYVFGGGVPMFKGKEFKKYEFSLQSVKKLNKRGTILLKYKNEN